MSASHCIAVRKDWTINVRFGSGLPLAAVSGNDSRCIGGLLTKRKKSYAKGITCQVDVIAVEPRTSGNVGIGSTLTHRKLQT